MTPSPRSCPQCGSPIAGDDFQCTACELLLDPDAISEDIKTEPSLIRALLSPPERRPSGDLPVVDIDMVGFEEESLPVTDRFVLPAFAARPRLLAGLEIAGKLTGLEAHVASFIDGQASIPTIAESARLSEIEVQAVLRTLQERRVVELVHSPRPPPQVRPDVTRSRAPPPVLSPAAPTMRRPEEGPAHRALAPAPASRPSAARPQATKAPEQIAPTRARPPLPVSVPPARVVPLQELPPVAAESEESVLQRAVALERSGQIDGAIHVLTRAMARAKSPAPLYNRLALILIAQRREYEYEQAEKLLQQAVELEPDNAVYQQNLFKVIGLRASAGEGGGKSTGGLLGMLRRRK